MKREALKLIAAGVCLGVNWALLFEAYKLMSVSMATLTYYTAAHYRAPAQPATA